MKALEHAQQDGVLKMHYNNDTGELPVFTGLTAIMARGNNKLYMSMQG
jgi:hypothetical protein